VIRADAVPQAVRSLHASFDLGASEVRPERPFGEEAR
jgi:hypothetical protein